MSPAIFVLLLMVAMIVAFASGKFNFAIIALCIPVVLQASGILTAAEAWAGFSNTGVLLFVPLFMLGAVLKKSSFLHHLKKLIRKLGQTRGAKLKILLLFGVCAVLLANFMNATAAIAMMAPLILALSSESKEFSRRGMTKFCADISCATRSILPFGSTLGAYLTANALLEASGTTYRFNILDPLMAKMPFVLIWFAFMVLFGYRFYLKKWTGDDPAELEMATVTEKEDPNDRGTTLTPLQDKLAYIIFFGGVAAMLFGTLFTKIPILIWAFIFALSAVFLNIVTPRECLNGMVWISILLAAGTIPLTTAITKSGANEYIAAAVNFVLGGNTNIYVMTAIFYLFSSITTQFMNDIASSQIYYALALAACVGLGIDPRPIYMAITIGALCSVCTPMANSGQALAYGTGGYKFWEYCKPGIVSWIAYFVLFMLYQPIYMNFILK